MRNFVTVQNARKFCMILLLASFSGFGTAQAGPDSDPVNPDPLGDYVPCRFTSTRDAQLRDRRAAPYEQGINDLRKQKFVTTEDDKGELNRLLDNAPRGALSGLVDQAFKNKWIQPTGAARTELEAKQKALELLNSSADRARDNADKPPLYTPPHDVGCSQSLLSWEEASDIFGRRIADTYFVFQVVVRNLSPDNEFVLHDVQVAINDESGRLFCPDRKKSCLSNDSKFVAGRDKVFARGVALHGQSSDRRNRTARALDASASILSAASVAFTGIDFKNAVSVFQAAAIPGFKSVFPDYTIDQLNRLNDWGFSSASAYKIVVGKTESAPFVTFLPTKIFANSAFGKLRNWSQQDLYAFQQNSVVVVAGVHVKEVENNQPRLSEISCIDKNGYLDFSKAQGGSLTCDLTGERLDLLSKLRLKSGDSTDNTTAEGNVTVSGTLKNAGKVTFKASDLRALTADEYLIYLVNSKGEATDTSIKVKIKKDRQ